MPVRRVPVRRVVVIAALATLALAVPLSATAAAPPPEPEPGPVSVYRVTGADSAAERTTVVRHGVDVLSGGLDFLEVRATPQEADELRATGLQLVPQPSAPLPLPSVLPRAGSFPPGFSGYHTYDELNSELNRLAQQHPDVVAVSSYGRSFEDRALPLVKISDSVGTDENEPEVLFSCAQHAREHLTVEMCLHIVQRLADGYGTDPAITDLVRSREIWVMPMTNPDGAEYDIANGSFAFWRKNRQPDGGAVGTDLNRNWGTAWACCGGSSGNPDDETYHGAGPFSAPETAQLRDWVNSRVIGGVQQITAHIDFHTFSELVLWPYGYTTDDTGPGLSAADAAAFRALGESMASTNGYTPQQSSDLYITDGSIGDWMWAQHHIWSFTFEMYPRSQLQGGFYPPDTEIKRETERNDDAVDLLLRSADCVPCAARP
ncbi:MAG TPA: M14 family metallopeptidase [Pseudonocardiaceae bacterium]|nr:M14 family metallopeptidase [Pseudonocardiaceae bacterium]